MHTDVPLAFAKVLAGNSAAAWSVHTAIRANLQVTGEVDVDVPQLPAYLPRLETVVFAPAEGARVADIAPECFPGGFASARPRCRAAPSSALPLGLARRDRESPDALRAAAFSLAERDRFRSTRHSSRRTNLPQRVAATRTSSCCTATCT